MSAQVDPRPSRQALRARREAIAARLTAAGLRPRRGPRPVDEAVDLRPAPVRLAGALRDLGPVLSVFGRYLARRLDLLDEGDARVLAAELPDRAAPMPVAELEPLLAAAWNRPPSEVLSALEPLPQHSGLLGQSHAARLIDGRAVSVEVTRPQAAAAALLDLPLLDWLAELLAAGDLALALEGTDLGDFGRRLATLVDPALRAAALETVRAAAGGQGDLTSPPAVVELSRVGVVVFERPAGATLAELAPAGDPSSGAALRTLLAGTPRAAELSGRLCAAWLSLAVRAGQVPVDVAADDLVVLEDDDRLSWLGGESAALPAGAQTHLWDYLVAAAGQDPDRAADALLAEMVPNAEADPAALRKRLRQAVPFRDGGPGAGEDLASYIFLHWRMARAAGFRPQPHLLPFERGLAALVATVRPLGGGDALREGIERCQLRAGLGDLGQLIDLRHMGRSAEQALGLMVALPERLDRLLTMLSEDRFAIRLETREAPEERARRRTSTAATGLLMAMAAVALLAHTLSASGTVGIWGERFATVLLAVLGLHLLRLLGRRP